MKGSLKMSTPVTMLVMGSKVLRMEARWPPMISVPFWNSTLAAAPARKAVRKQTPRHRALPGRRKVPVTRQTTSITAAQVAEM